MAGGFKGEKIAGFGEEVEDCDSLREKVMLSISRSFASLSSAALRGGLGCGPE